MKTCSCCGANKDLTRFVRRKGYKDGLASWCKECHYERTRQWKKDNPDSTKNSRLRHKFNITLERYKELFDEQGGVCAICKRKETVLKSGKTRQLAVDHDRACCPGEKSCGLCIRGLLCGYCNTALGLFEEDKERIRKAISYIENNQKEK